MKNGDIVRKFFKDAGVDGTFKVVEPKRKRFTYKKFLNLRSAIVNLGYGAEIAYFENLNPVEDSFVLRDEAIYVIINAGMKWTVAKEIYRKCMIELNSSNDCSAVFGHTGKVDAINGVWRNYEELWRGFVGARSKSSADAVEFLSSIPYVGDITKYHLARNLGIDCVKPDRHLIRIAKNYGYTPEGLCYKLSVRSGYRIGTVDYILWRSAERGLI